MEGVCSPGISEEAIYIPYDPVEMNWVRIILKVNKDIMRPYTVQRNKGITGTKLHKV